MDFFPDHLDLADLPQLDLPLEIGGEQDIGGELDLSMLTADDWQQITDAVNGTAVEKDERDDLETPAPLFPLEALIAPQQQDHEMDDESSTTDVAPEDPEALPQLIPLQPEDFQLPVGFKFDDLKARRGYKIDPRKQRAHSRRHHLRRGKGKYTTGQVKDIHQAALKNLLCRLIEHDPTNLNIINSSGLATIQVVDNLPKFIMADEDVIIERVDPRDFIEPKDFDT